MKRILIGLCLILLAGCSPGPTGTPVSTPSSSDAQPCAYMWATQSLNDLTLDLQTAIKELQPNAEGYAYAYGEDCVYQDGRRTFHTMETDFNVTMPVTDLTDENALGDWIVKVMNVIGNLPAEKIAGPKPGRVAIYFISGTDQKPVNFYIDKYQTLEPGMSGLEIYQALQAAQ